MPVFDQEQEQPDVSQADDVIEKAMEGLYDQKTLEWRQEQFAKLGMTEEWSSFFASSRTDYHAAEAFVTAGATVHSAMTILAGYTATGEIDPTFDWETFEKLGVTA